MMFIGRDGEITCIILDVVDTYRDPHTGWVWVDMLQ